ncbi:MAG TPA: GAF and ANTAR domain-containing protein [Acidimicrobiales bacterium]|nr:GAF and ANTAR domain-containing protein [Acidimicrobiales bacterium]
MADIGQAPTSAAAFERLCTASVELLPVSGMGAMVMSGGQHRGTLFSSDARAHTMEQLQFSLGEGPCLDAYNKQRPVLVAALRAERSWPAFTPAAIDAGLGAIFAFPLQAFEARVGAFDFYREEPGSLGEDDVETALTLAEAGTRLVLDVVAERPPGWLPAPLERMMDSRRRVHQATGMVAVQLEVDVDEALACLRAHAWSQGRPLGEVAADVVARRISFDA